MTRKLLLSLGVLIVGSAALAVPAEAQGTPSPNLQINSQFLSDLMRSAMVFNGMIQGLNLNRSLHESGIADNDPSANPNRRAAAVLGAGAGVGLAVGGMTGGQKGAVIGALAGSAGAYVIDQLVQHQAAKARLANADNYRDNYRDNNHQYDRDNDSHSDHELPHFKQRPTF